MIKRILPLLFIAVLILSSCKAQHLSGEWIFLNGRACLDFMPQGELLSYEPGREMEKMRWKYMQDTLYTTERDTLTEVINILKLTKDTLVFGYDYEGEHFEKILLKNKEVSQSDTEDFKSILTSGTFIAAAFTLPGKKQLSADTIHFLPSGFYNYSENRPAKWKLYLLRGRLVLWQEEYSYYFLVNDFDQNHIELTGDDSKNGPFLLSLSRIEE